MKYKNTHQTQKQSHTHTYTHIVNIIYKLDKISSALFIACVSNFTIQDKNMSKKKHAMRRTVCVCVWMSVCVCVCVCDVRRRISAH